MTAHTPTNDRRPTAQNGDSDRVAETDHREPDNAPSYAATKAERYHGTFGGVAPNLFACSFCGAVVAHREIPLHTKWHQDIAELLALEAAR